jgi:hypothetical protein
LIGIASGRRGIILKKDRQAIRAILSQSIELRRVLLPYLVITNGELTDVRFEVCLKQKDLSSGLRAAIIWMWCIWAYKSAGHDLIALSSAMDADLRAATLKGLRIFWSKDE